MKLETKNTHKSIDRLYCKHPCSQCPFVNAQYSRGWLGKDRAQEICSTHSFVCHKDTSRQCAGHMLVLKDDNTFYALAKLLCIDLNLKGDDKVFDNAEHFIAHHTIK